MAAPAGWQTYNAGGYYRVWQRTTGDVIRFEEHPVQATAETRAQNVENDKAARK